MSCQYTEPMPFSEKWFKGLALEGVESVLLEKNPSKTTVFLVISPSTSPGEVMQQFVKMTDCFNYLVPAFEIVIAVRCQRHTVFE